MVVDFELRKWPAFGAVTVSWTGPWNEARIRREFEGLARWADKMGVTTGTWVFQESGARKFTAAITVKGKVHGTGRVKVRQFPAASVASVTFNPDQVSPRVVYHGLTDWLRWRKKDHTIKSVGTYREVYTANPWTNPKAWAKTTIQVVVRK